MPKRKPADFNRQARPPKITRKPQVWTVQADEVLDCVVLSEKMHGFTTHWDGKHTIPCLQPRTNCRGCIAKMPERWAGYIDVAYGQRWRKILALPPLAGESLLAQVGERPLRGAIIQVKRERPYIRAPLVVTVTNFSAIPEKLPAECDIMAVLRAIWHIDKENASTA